jgi:serine/threonine protein kinase
MIATQLLDALDFIHKRGCVHRDIKPDNFLFRDAARTVVTICDFGLSLSKGSPETKDSFVGTDAWMAPELWTRDASDRRKVDVWALGVVFAQMLQGKLPWTGAVENYQTQIAACQPVLEKKVDPELRELVLSMLRPVETRASLAQVREALERLARGLDVGRLKAVPHQIELHRGRSLMAMPVMPGRSSPLVRRPRQPARVSAAWSAADSDPDCDS